MTEHEELLMLRALAAKQAQELESSRKIIEERDEKIRRQNIQIDNVIQALLHARKNCLVHPPRSAARWMVSCRCSNLSRNLPSS
ncbi:MAG: hypothetical protein ACLU6Y_14660 [Ruminococcus sp.]